MKSIRINKDWPQRHKDFKEVAWGDDTYSFAVRIFGGVPNSVNDTQLRPGRCFLPKEMESELNPESRNDLYWQKYVGINKDAYGIISNIPKEHLKMFQTGVPRITKDVLTLMYEIYKAK